MRVQGGQECKFYPRDTLCGPGAKLGYARETRNSMPMIRTIVASSLLVFASASLTLLTAEYILRLAMPDSYYVWPPKLSRIFQPAEGLMPGIEGNARFIVNEAGLRGDPLPDDLRPQLLAIGGSTTESIYLDQTETWPQLLQQKLGTEDLPVWVGNAGKAGTSSRHHVLQIEKLLDQHPTVSTVVMLVGVNDLNTRLTEDEAYQPLPYKEYSANPGIVQRAFSRYPAGRLHGIHLRDTVIWHRLKQLGLILFPPNTMQDSKGEMVLNWRRFRREAETIIRVLPAMDSALAEYRANIGRIVEIAKAHKVRIILLTQPAVWRPDLPPALSQLLWFGWKGNPFEKPASTYYSVGAMASGMRRFNDALMTVCGAYSVECIDLARSLPKDTRTFYDDFHFNENGARQVATIVAGYLRENPQGKDQEFVGSY